MLKMDDLNTGIVMYILTSSLDNLNTRTHLGYLLIKNI